MELKYFKEVITFVRISTLINWNKNKLDKK